jgi:amino acid adenylation domain-containing protein
LKGTIKYSTELFARERVERMAAHLTTLLRAAAADPSRKISRLALLTEGERRQLLSDWNRTASDLPSGVCLPGAFEEQARRTPDAAAVVFHDDSLTYAQLNGRANRLARHLRKLGAGPEAKVGLLLERSVDAIACLLGILKSGAAYVPLDPSAPEERLSYVMRDAGVRLLLTRRGLLAGPQGDGLLVIDLDDERELIELESEEDLRVPLHPDNLAYVIYTSGSTGRPKGVMVRHGSVLNLAQALQQAVYRKRGDGPQRVGLNAPLTFDASVKQLTVLLYGHTLCLMPEEKRGDGPAFLAYAAGQRLDAFDCTPSHLELLLAAGLAGREDCRGLRLLVGGEAFAEHLWQGVHSAGLTAFNVYGPTECTVDATVCEVGEHPSAPTIGRPLDNVRVYLLDPRGEPVPVGVPGEIHIGGAGLARGYLGRPGLTACSFVPDPFGPRPGERLYRTGDLACFLPDGRIKFLGRADHQVKVRGYRIELGEIEAVLLEHPSVREAVVVAREDEPGDRRLAAYVVSASADPPAPEELRGFLKTKLPDYMLPQTYTPLAALPLTASGKVDRRALPAPDRPRPAGDAEPFTPRTAAEEVLAGLFAQLLGVEEVGIYDNFFELGGHSLLATQLISQLQDIFPTEVPLLTLFFEDPTVAGLAAALVESSGAESVEKIAQLMKALDELPDEQVEAMLSEREVGLGVTSE